MLCQLIHEKYSNSSHFVIKFNLQKKVKDFYNENLNLNMHFIIIFNNLK